MIRRIAEVKSAAPKPSSPITWPSATQTLWRRGYATGWRLPAAARAALGLIYRAGYRYQRAGVVLLELSPAGGADRGAVRAGGAESGGAPGAHAGGGWMESMSAGGGAPCAC
jgi:hypothetical protein